MRFIKFTRAYRHNGDDRTYCYTQVIFVDGGRFYVARVAEEPDMHERYVDITPGDLKRVEEIPVGAYRPSLRVGFTIASPTAVLEGYIKETNPLAIQIGVDPKMFVLQEIAACEALRRRPHPSLARYRGCVATDGQVSALVYDKYAVSLLDLVNPRGVGKADFYNSARPYTPGVFSRYIRDVRSGLMHLHWCGLVHNDLNPSNVMISSFDRAVIIDFDSCMRIGAPLGRTKRTPGWYDPCVGVSEVDNDWSALEEIRIWLEGSTAGTLQFPE